MFDNATANGAGAGNECQPDGIITRQVATGSRIHLPMKHSANFRLSANT